MKTTTQIQTVNSLKTTLRRTAVNGENYVIEISLDDDCKNGHNDFSITGSIYEAGHWGGDYWCTVGGAIGNRVAKEFPELAIFDRLHLCDFRGVPTYATANGFYHIHKSTKEVAMSYLRVTESEYNGLCKTEDVQIFTYLLHSFGIVERWKAEAAQAIALLETMIGGVKFLDNSTRIPEIDLQPEVTAEIEARLNLGYYNEINQAKRAAAKIEAAKQKALLDIAADYDRAVNKATTERKAKEAVLYSGLPLNNFIFYSHTMQGRFNWKSYEDQITQNQFDKFIGGLSAYDLPEGITFKLGDN